MSRFAPDSSPTDGPRWSRIAKRRGRFAARPGVEGLEGRTLLSVAVLKDIDQQDLYPSQITDVNGTAYFVTAGPSDGYELWKSSGSSAGTVKLGDFPASAVGGTVAGPKNLTDFDGTLYFSVTSPVVTGDEIERVNPTTGAIQAVTLLQGALGDQPSQFTVVNGLLFFTDTGADGGLNLLRTDGTASGTIVLKSDVRGTENYAGEEIAGAGDTLYFASSDAAHGRELWESDGTVAGTKIVADLTAGPADSDPSAFTVLGSELIFEILPDDAGSLWETDGTSAGTVELDANEALYLGGARAVVGSSLYFAGASGEEFNGLWVSDGTASGTKLVTNLSALPSAGAITSMTAAQGRLYFSTEISANTPSGDLADEELWVSDGTAAGTAPLASFYPENVGDLGYVAPVLMGDGTNVLFDAYDSDHGLEPWSSDGTTAGTGPIGDLDPGPDGSDPQDLVAVGGRVDFAAHDGTNANELWSSDGTASGTSLVAAFPYIQTSGSFVTPNPYYNSIRDYAITIGGTTYFNAVDADHGDELWKTDGTPAGTVLVKDIVPGPDASYVEAMTSYNGALYFLAMDPATGSPAFWTSDGTSAGTVEIFGAPAGYSYNRTPEFTEFQGRLYFLATGDGGEALFSTDGTVAGTAKVATFPGVTGYVSTDTLVASGNMLYFNLGDATNDGGFWATDGTAAGTREIQSTSAGSPTAIDGRVIYSYNDGVHGSEPWITDGTTAGTFLLDDLAAGSTSSNPEDFTVIGSRVYFAAGTGAADGGWIWSSDGTTAGTQAIAANSGVLYTDGDIIAIGSTIVYTSGEGSSDGVYAVNTTSDQETTLFVDPSSTSVSTLYRLDGRAYFTLTTALGESVYETDDTPGGTVDLGLIGPESGLSPPFPVQVLADGNLVLFGDDGIHGGEPLLVTDPPILDAIPDQTVVTGSAIQLTATASKPGATVQFSLAGGSSSGAAINPSSGVFTWTAPAVLTTTSYSLTIVATDLANPSLTASRTFQVIDQPINHAPVLGPLANPAVDQDSLLTFTATATDQDPGQSLAFSLDAGAPSGAIINRATGIFTWTPSASLSPGVYPITVRVTDDGTPALSASQLVDITVVAPPTPLPPVIAAIPDQTIDLGGSVTLTVMGSDPNPARHLTYSLPGSLTSIGATIDPTTGVFHFSDSTLAAGILPIIVYATDDGSPSQTATGTFNINIVSPPLVHAGHGIGIDLGTVFSSTASVTLSSPVASDSVDFGDGTAPIHPVFDASGQIQFQHTYAQIGQYTVTITVTDALGGVGTGTIQVGVEDAPNAQPGVLGFSTTPYSVDERDGTATITIERTGGSGGPISIDYATQDVGSPAAGVSYTPVSGTLNFAVGETNKTISVPILDAGYTSGITEFSITLSNPTGGATILPYGSVADVIITDDDPVTQPQPQPQTTPTPTPTSTPITVPAISLAAKRGSLMGIVVQFSGAVNGAGNLGDYHLVQVVKHGRKTTSKTIALKAASYDASTSSVTLTPAKKVPSATPLQITITSAGITDGLGRPIDGNHDGQPGGDLIATINRSRVTIESTLAATPPHRRGSRPFHRAPRPAKS